MRLSADCLPPPQSHRSYNSGLGTPSPISPVTQLSHWAPKPALAPLQRRPSPDLANALLRGLEPSQNLKPPTRNNKLMCEAKATTSAAQSAQTSRGAGCRVGKGRLVTTPCKPSLPVTIGHLVTTSHRPMAIAGTRPPRGVY